MMPSILPSCRAEFATAGKEMKGSTLAEMDAAWEAIKAAQKVTSAPE